MWLGAHPSISAFSQHPENTFLKVQPGRILMFANPPSPSCSGKLPWVKQHLGDSVRKQKAKRIMLCLSACVHQQCRHRQKLPNEHSRVAIERPCIFQVGLKARVLKHRVRTRGYQLEFMIGEVRPLVWDAQVMLGAGQPT